MFQEACRLMAPTGCDAAADLLSDALGPRELALGDSLRAGQHETVLRTTQARRRSDGPGGSQQHGVPGVVAVLRRDQRQGCRSRCLREGRLQAGPQQ